MARHVSAISACTWLAVIVCFVFCWSFSNASMHMEDTDRRSWANDVENMRNDPYVSELFSRLRALNDAEETGLAQYELNRYFRKHVPFCHQYNEVPNKRDNLYHILCPEKHTKRGLDFGLGRDFSATQAAKHKMGLAAAAFPGGPGRRRRSVEQALHL